MSNKKRSRKLFIVEIANENWHTITRIRKKATRALNAWNKEFGEGKAVLIIVDVPEARQL